MEDFFIWRRSGDSLGHLAWDAFNDVGRVV